jgi:hypothetical protein
MINKGKCKMLRESEVHSLVPVLFFTGQVEGRKKNEKKLK